MKQTDLMWEDSDTMHQGDHLIFWVRFALSTPRYSQSNPFIQMIESYILCLHRDHLLLFFLLVLLSWYPLHRRWSEFRLAIELSFWFIQVLPFSRVLSWVETVAFRRHIYLIDIFRQFPFQKLQVSSIAAPFVQFLFE